MRTAGLDYDLPTELIAQKPLRRRDASRLMVVDRAGESVRTTTFSHLPEYMTAGDCLVLNDTRVIAARLRGVKSTGAKIDILLLNQERPGRWRALVRPARRVRVGTVVDLRDSLRATVAGVEGNGIHTLEFSEPGFADGLDRFGETPLPPYIKRGKPRKADRKRYQTVYAQTPGAVAAPTAGLHFTERLIRKVREKDVRVAFLTLHVGYGTFKGITADTVEDHEMGPEWFAVPRETAAAVQETVQRGGRVFAVGTTVCRVLEHCAGTGWCDPLEGWTNLYITPGYEFRVVGVLVTNFHLPRTSLLALVMAFAGCALARKAYDAAIEQRFRFYSYGDAMLIL
jgi:S-adenosylmethionine:tRNA ribosyltransferase-isomerase